MLLSLLGCLYSVQRDLVTASRPTASEDAGLEVSGRDCTFWTLHLFPSRTDDRAVLGDLVADLAGDEFHALVEVTIDQRDWYVPVLGTLRCVYVSGRRVLVEQPTPPAGSAAPASPAVPR